MRDAHASEARRTAEECPLPAAMPVSPTGAMRPSMHYARSLETAAERPLMAPSIAAAVRSAAAFTGLSARCAYCCVVLTSRWPRMAAMRGSERPPATPSRRCGAGRGAGRLAGRRRTLRMYRPIGGHYSAEGPLAGLMAGAPEATRRTLVRTVGRSREYLAFNLVQGLRVNFADLEFNSASAEFIFGLMASPSRIRGRSI